MLLLHDVSVCSSLLIVVVLHWTSQTTAGAGAVGRRAGQGVPSKGAAAAAAASSSPYDVVNTFSDPRKRNFPCDADTVSEDEVDRLERENFELSSEEEYKGDDGDDGDGDGDFDAADDE